MPFEHHIQTTGRAPIPDYLISALTESKGTVLFHGWTAGALNVLDSSGRVAGVLAYFPETTLARMYRRKEEKVDT